MGRTSINISESTIKSASVVLDEGSVAVVLSGYRGDPNLVHDVRSADQFLRIFGNHASNLAYRKCLYLLRRGNPLKVVTEALTGTKASVLFPFKAGTGTTGLHLTAKANSADYGNITVKAVKQSIGNRADVLFDLVISESGVEIETFSNICLDSESDKYFGLTVNSDLFALSLDENTNNSTIFPDDAPIKSGTGIQSPTVTNGTGTPNGGVADLTAAALLLADRNVSFATAIVPSQSGANAKSILNTVIENRQDFLAVIDNSLVDSDLSSTASIDTKISTTDGLRSSYIATYYPKVKIKAFGDSVDPSVPLVDLIGRLHRDNLVYKAPAGVANGLLTDVIGVARNLSSTEVANLQEENVNPIVVRTGVGNVVWGNSCATLSGADINKISVRILVNYFKRAVYALSQKYIFEANRQQTWDKWVAEVTPIVRDIYNANGIQNYSVVCDRSIMSDEDIANGIMRGVVTIQPNFQIETINVVFTVDETGVSFEE